MNWLQHGSRWLSTPYQIVSNERGFEVWIRTEERYHKLACDLPSLAKAKLFCETHAKASAPHAQ